MDLGLKELTDDQIIELLQETLGELATRDHMVREAAKSTIQTTADRLRDFRRLLPLAVQKVRKEYLSQLEADIYQAIRDGVSTGHIRVVSMAEELATIAAINNDDSVYLRASPTAGGVRLSKLHKSLECPHLHRTPKLNPVCVPIAEIGGPLLRGAERCPKCWGIEPARKSAKPSKRRRKHPRRHVRRRIHRRNPIKNPSLVTISVPVNPSKKRKP